MVVLLMLIPLLAPQEGAAVGFATISKALGYDTDTVRFRLLSTVRSLHSAASLCGSAPVHQVISSGTNSTLLVNEFDPACERTRPCLSY